jgi:hypothetical protein
MLASGGIVVAATSH